MYLFSFLMRYSFLISFSIIYCFIRFRKALVYFNCYINHNYQLTYYFASYFLFNIWSYFATCWDSYFYRNYFCRFSFSMRLGSINEWNWLYLILYMSNRFLKCCKLITSKKQNIRFYVIVDVAKISSDFVRCFSNGLVIVTLP